MSNIKKPRSEKKKSVSFSIKTRHLEDFIDNCNRSGIIVSHKIEEFIISYNNSLL